ncbi:MAG: TRAM domain-containing protein [Candidatus Sumerlaeaceae bacterium]|nr:TRAM domain-containing protein [Candidatus Sumerlaeaceae bacterium]
MRFVRNPVLITRVFFVLITTLIGYWVGRDQVPSYGLEYSTVAFLLALAFVLFEFSTDIVSSKKILLAAAGLMCGLVIAWFVYPTIPPGVFGDVKDFEKGQMKARIICNLLFGYFGVILAIKHANRFSFSRLNFIMASPGDTAKILDTSVIVDGRIKELMAGNFMTGNFVVPEFVLDELQKIADSSDSKKRARGRRGLDVLDSIKDTSARLAIWEKDFPEIKDVDHKLIALAKETGGEIVTNDFNLQKVAQLHKVRVININEMANLLRPSVFVGESLALIVSREGKEPQQGVGYLEDGTMVVVEEARPHIGGEVEVQVTSILQTPAGRMIFARMTEAPLNHDSASQRNAGNGGDTPLPRRARERV